LKQKNSNKFFMIKNNSSRHFRKLHNAINIELSQIKNPIILEFGVSNDAMSTEFFLKYCELNSGQLYSIDINNYQNKFSSKNWKFIQSRDDNFNFLENKIPSSFDIIYLDTIHKPEHVKKIFYYYYPKLKIGGYFLIDDISWLPYVKGAEKEQFYIERNNEESFQKILEIFYSNRNNFDLNFSLIGTGLAKIEKLNSNDLLELKKISSEKFTIKNFLRKIWLNFFKN
jgi:predicted O-methyltransferase YrrM